MSFISRFILFTSAIIVSLFILAAPTWAKDFSADYDVDYTLQPDKGSMHVTQHVTLTNQVPNLRVSSYSLTLENNSFTNISAKDGGGALKFTESKDDEGSPVITFTFNDRVVGVGNKLKWTIEYDSPTLAQHHGQTWDITIPRVKEHASYDISSYNANLIVPKTAGPAAFISPSATTDASTETNYIYKFNKDQVLPTGIVATFGNAQFFRFTLKYHLRNPNIGRAKTDIALPPDIPNYQQIIYDQLTPAPQSLHTDEDGNAMATYYLTSKGDLDVTFTGWAKTIAAKPNLSSKALASDIPADIVATYTKEDEFWQTSDKAIKDKVAELTDPDKPVVENAKAIYDYVTTTLQYNTGRINADLKRMGASAAFAKPEDSVCMEFTDVFVTMARIAGIPAREVDGYAYTTDEVNHPIYYPGLGSDILHAWAQIYLPDSGWVMVDPTWGSTTGGVDFFGRIDLNRIAFAIKGTSSTSPLTAGSYKTNKNQDGDVAVAFSDTVIEPKVALGLSMDDTTVISGIGSTSAMRLTNTGNVTLYELQLEAKAKSPVSVPGSQVKIAALLPGQAETAWLPLRATGWLTTGGSTLAATVKGHDIAKTEATANQAYDLRIQPFFAAIVVPILVLILIVGAAVGGGWFGLHRWYDRSSQDAPTSRSDSTPI